GSRRAHGADAALKAARALYLAGFASTSNVLAGRDYGIPVAGTMAHSYVEAHDREIEAFRAFARTYPETTLLVDTYDTESGVRLVGRLAEELGEAFRVRGVRIDSGDLSALAKQARRILDAAGLRSVQIMASGGLDERAIDALLESGAPIAGFGVGTSVVVSNDAPSLDAAYKLVAYEGRGTMKLSTRKATLPGAKQVYRRREAGIAAGDVIALNGEAVPGEPLLREVMRDGRRLPAGRESLEEARERAQAEVAALPDRLRALTPAQPPYPVEVSPGLREAERRLRQELAERVAS
ncbi:MAG: nicotinate phosphoribosyltransferase, partial [Chloroflexota bacterium]|nr:nicotinate phosphoribosyltransferase [Chloroflexota bacterium]